MTNYARDTVVPIERSRSEIERTLTRYGAEMFMYATKPDKAMIGFQVRGRQVKLVIPMPTSDDKAIQRDGRGTRRTPKGMQEAIEKEARRRWRSLALVIKAKLEAVSSGLVMFEDEFLAYMVLPNGETVGQWTRPQLEAAYQSGKMPPLLPSGLE